MSMTQEQALKLLEHPIYKWSMDWDEREDGLNYTEAIEIAIAALRPVSREQVEKVFGGKWEEETYTTVSGRGRVIHSKKYTCSVCGKANGRAKTNFCPHCGAPMTDEAVQMVMERLNKLEETKK